MRTLKKIFICVMLLQIITACNNSTKPNEDEKETEKKKTFTSFEKSVNSGVSVWGNLNEILMQSIPEGDRAEAEFNIKADITIFNNQESYKKFRLDQFIRDSAHIYMDINSSKPIYSKKKGELEIVKLREKYFKCINEKMDSTFSFYKIIGTKKKENGIDIDYSIEVLVNSDFKVVETNKSNKSLIIKTSED